MNLITNKETEILHVLPLLPPSRNNVPLRRGANDDIAFLEQAKVSTRLSRQAHDILAALDSPKLRLPLGQTKINHILIRLNTNRTSRLWLTPEPHQREFCTNGFPATSGGTDEYVIVCGIQGLEDLGLDLVERFDGGRVDSFELFVMKGGNREMLEIEESGRWGELLGEDEMFERNGDAGFRVQPSIGNDGDEVVRGNGVEHRDGNRDVVFHFGVFLPEDECVTEKNNFAIDIFYEDRERLSTAMDSLVPTEVRDDSEVDTKEGTGNRLN